MAAYYALPSDELQSSITPTLEEGSAAAGYPLTNLTDTLPHTAFRPDATDAFEIQWDAGSARAWGLLTLHAYTIDAGSAVKVYCTNTAYSGGTPGGGDTASPTILAARGDGIRYGVLVDLTGFGSKRYVRLRVPAQASVAAAIGEVKLTASKREFTNPFDNDVDHVNARHMFISGSDVGVETFYDFGVTRRRLTIKRWLLTETVLSEFEGLLYAVKIRATPFLFVANPAASPQDPWIARFAAEPIITRIGNGLYQTSCLIDEVSGGVPITA